MDTSWISWVSHEDDTTKRTAGAKGKVSTCGCLFMAANKDNLRSVCLRFNLKEREVLALNKKRYEGLVPRAKLREGTILYIRNEGWDNTAEGTYEVNRLRSSRKSKTGSGTEYLVEWNDDKGTCTWEPAQNIPDDVIDEYLEQRASVGRKKKLATNVPSKAPAKSRSLPTTKARTNQRSVAKMPSKSPTKVPSKPAAKTRTDQRTVAKSPSKAPAKARAVPASATRVTQRSTRAGKGSTTSGGQSPSTESLRRLLHEEETLRASWESRALKAEAALKSANAKLESAKAVVTMLKETVEFHE